MAFGGVSLIQISHFPPILPCSGSGKSGIQTPGVLMDGQNRGQIPLGACWAAPTQTQRGVELELSPAKENLASPENKKKRFKVENNSLVRFVWGMK